MLSVCNDIKTCNAFIFGGSLSPSPAFLQRRVFGPHLHPLSYTNTHVSKDGKGLRWRGFKWRIDGWWLWSQITRYTCFALHDFLLLFLVTLDNKNCYKTLLTRKQNTDGMLNVKHLGMAIDSGLKSCFCSIPVFLRKWEGDGRKCCVSCWSKLPATKEQTLCWGVTESAGE